MSPVRRAPMDPRLPGWDRDREMAASDPEPESRPRPRPDGVPGPAIVLAIVGVPLLILIVVAILALAASRPGQTSSAAQSGAPHGLWGDGPHASSASVRRAGERPAGGAP